MAGTNARRIWAMACALMLIVMVTMNGLANALPLNGVNTGQLSDEIPNLFVPAGVTFAIWGLIYALLTGYVASVAVIGFGAGREGAWEPADGALFCANAALNSGWILAWHWRLVGLAMAIMLGILGTLIALTERQAARDRAAPAVSPGGLLGFFQREPLRVYLGWICVATIANATALLVTLGWDGGSGAAWWAAAVIAAGAVVGCLLALSRGALSSALVVLWAFAGIILKRQAAGDGAVVVAAAALGMAALAAAVVAALVRRRRA